MHKNIYFILSSPLTYIIIVPCTDVSQVTMDNYRQRIVQGSMGSLLQDVCVHIYTNHIL